MDLLRTFLTLICLCFSLNTFSATETDNLGIGFIHGTNDHRLDAEGGYWKTGFIILMSQALHNIDNYKVVSCDFRQTMWHEEAAGCVADQLLQFIEDKKITKLVVYTHSHGANIIRWILSNQVYDPRYKQLSEIITQVIALAPSSAGTPLADEVMQGNIFEASLGWLLGYRNDSVRQQRVGDMAIYNEEILYGTAGRPSLPVAFRAVAGSDVTASPISSASYCNGYFQNIGLKLTKLYLDSCADGFLNCSSQGAAGKLWFYDTQKTIDNIPLSHNQSRHNCFGFEQVLINDLAKQGA